MELKYSLALPGAVCITYDVPPPPGMTPLPDVPIRCHNYGDNKIYVQRLEDLYYRLVRFHIILADATRLTPRVQQRTLAFAFLLKGEASGTLQGVEGILHFRAGYCYVPLLMPGTDEHSQLDLEAGSYEILVILLGKDREKMILKIFEEFHPERKRLQQHDGKGLPYPPLPITPEVRMLLEPLIRYREHPAFLLFTAERCVSEVVKVLLRAYQEQSELPEDIRRIHRYVSAQLRESITIKATAGRLRMSEKHLCKLIREHFCTTFKSYVTGLRMQQARILLANPDCQLQIIALDLGYSSKGHFSNAFRKHAGMSPSAYRAGLLKT